MWVMGWSWETLGRTPGRVVRKAMERLPTYVKLSAGLQMRGGG